MKVKVKMSFEFHLDLDRLTEEDAIAEFKEELEDEFDDTSNLIVEITKG